MLSPVGFLELKEHCTEGCSAFSAGLGQRDPRARLPYVPPPSRPPGCAGTPAVVPFPRRGAHGANPTAGSGNAASPFAAPGLQFQPPWLGSRVRPPSLSSSPAPPSPSFLPAAPCRHLEQLTWRQPAAPGAGVASSFLTQLRGLISLAVPRFITNPNCITSPKLQHDPSWSRRGLPAWALAAELGRGALRSCPRFLRYLPDRPRRRK